MGSRMESNCGGNEFFNSLLGPSEDREEATAFSERLPKSSWTWTSPRR